MQPILERHQIEKLRKTYRCANDKNRQLAQVVLLYSEGWTQSKIAKTLNLDVQTIVAYLQEYFNPKKRLLRQRLTQYTLNPDQTADLVAHIEQNPNASVRNIIEHIEQEYRCIWSEAAVYLFFKTHHFSRRSKQVLDREETTKSGQKRLIYRSVPGWHRDKQSTLNNSMSDIASANKS